MHTRTFQVVSELLAHRKLMHLRTFRQHVFNSRVAANEGVFFEGDVSHSVLLQAIKER